MTQAMSSLQLPLRLHPSAAYRCPPRHPQIRSGIVLLDKKSISVLGGRVESLAEAWEVQRKFGGLDRLRPSGPDADEIPPPFKQFQPGHKSKPKPLRPAETPAAAQITPPFPPGLQPRAEEPPPPPGGGRGGRGRGRGARGEAEVQERGCVVQQGGEGGGSGEHRQSARGVRGRGVVGVRSPGRPEAVEPPQREEGQQRREGHSRLQGKLAAGEQQRREELEEKRQRHRQNRARRRGGGDDGYGGGGDDGSMTLEEYEARRKAQQAPRELTQVGSFTGKATVALSGARSPPCFPAAPHPLLVLFLKLTLIPLPSSLPTPFPLSPPPLALEAGSWLRPITVGRLALLPSSLLSMNGSAPLTAAPPLPPLTDGTRRAARAAAPEGDGPRRQRGGRSGAPAPRGCL